MTTMLKWLAFVLTSLCILAGLTWWAIGEDWRALLADPPQDADILFWSQNQRDVGFKMMDELPALVSSNPIEISEHPQALTRGKDLDIPFDMNAFFEEQRLAGALILHKGEIRYERYALGLSPDKRWTSFSVAKSFTSSLVGIALKEGHIKSLDDKVSDYIKGLRGSAYDDVTVHQLLTMTSGVRWNEDYTDPGSDVAMFNKHVSNDGLPTIVSYMKALPRIHPPGTKWHYSTGETNLIGILVSEASGQPIAQYLSEKIWQPYGMEKPATWLLSPDGREISGCCIQASLRDFARYGQFILDGGKINGEHVLPHNWLKMATTKRTDIGQQGRGYGYQWWTFDDGSFTARGIFGQTIYIDPMRELVVAMNGNWPNASNAELNRKRFDFIDKLRLLLDEGG